MKKRLLLLMSMLMMMSVSMFSQTRTITGKVTNSDTGEPVIGATISVKGKNTGTSTDAKGNFLLQTDQKRGTLVASFVGMTTIEVPLTSSNVYRFTMTPGAVGLGEVVVTALGISREKRSLGYAVQTVDNKQLSEVKPENIVNALSGKVAGVQVTNATGAVGGSSRIVIRGESSFTSSQPLWVVDGTPFINFESNKDPYDGADFGNGALDLDPSNIESITVLKGANAAALYGSRGANGVIVVTTKRGSKTKGFGVEVSSAVTADVAPYLPYYQNKYGGGNNGSEWYWNKYNKDHGTSLTYQQYAQQFGYSYVDGKNGVNDGTPSSWGPRLDIGLMLPQFTSPLDASGNPVPTPWISHPNNVRDFYETGITADNSIALSKSGDLGSMRAYFNDNRVQGTLPNTDYRKNTFGFSNDLKLNDRLKFSSNLTYVVNRSDNMPSQGYYGDAPNSPQSGVTFMPRQVDIVPLKKYWNTIMPSGMPYNFGTGETPNPYLQAHNTNSQDRNRIFGNVALDLKLTDWLTLRGRVGTDYYDQNQKSISRELTFRATDGSGLNGTFSESNIMQSETNYDLLAIFNKKLGSNFVLDGTVGGNLMDARTARKTIGANDLVVPDLFTIANAKGVQSVSEYNSKKETQSVFGSFNLSYKDYLYLGVTGRNDWSSTLPKNEWSYFYPSFSLGFVFTDAFHISSDILSYGKVRGSWADVGRDTGPFMLQPTYQPLGGGLWNGNGLYTLPGTLPNQMLKPEANKSIEIGGNFKFFKNRIGIDVSYYDAKNQDQILNVAVPNASGYNAVTINAGEIENKGIEVILNAIPIETRNFRWNLDINYAKNKNRVNSLYKDLETYQISSMWASSIEARPGEAFGTIIGNAYRRDAAGNILVTDAGRILRDNNKEVGNVTPKWLGGMTNTFTYKNLSLRVLLDTRIGGDFVAGTIRWGGSGGALKYTAEGNIRETGLVWNALRASDGKPNTQNISAAAYMSDWSRTVQNWVVDGSYIKLREVAIGYTLPVSKMGHLGNFVHSASIALIGRNLAILYHSKENKFGIDPEVSSGNSLVGLGYEQMTVPVCRNIGARLTFSF